MAFVFQRSRVLMREVPKSSQTGLVKFAIANDNPSIQLFRDWIRELPRLFKIYDVDMPIPEGRRRIANFIREHKDVKDERVIRMLVSKGYLDLEEGLLQYKTRHDFLNKLDPTSILVEPESDLERFLKGNITQ
eukprot:CAMPEP_0114360778 /NCGR_PEP_ID=MMETSP0101-20121206/24122_1 /TAXON_ID=38822 ORGANISM="Pteridomonas danica, Strain PT" /NCGR_SAMPLE_ID=MMETSP0101 /ASSEMBLY_ACC=CAM_ASM_000211 /LENGTH=132 /DNA_ID=CAMNT_0001505191 /DNA_START=27 /DNA_END=425 /DNA_ORIENTATION=+